MGVRIPPKAASKAFMSVADEAGKLAYQVADELGIEVSKATKADADLIKGVIKSAGPLEGEAQDAVVGRVKNYLANQDNPKFMPAAETEVSPATVKARLASEAPTERGPAAVRADLENPPAIQGPRGLATSPAIDAEYIEPGFAGLPALRQDAGAALLDKSQTVSRPAPTPVITPAISGNQATPEELRSLAAKLKKPAAAAAVGGAALAASNIGAETPPPVEGAAKAEEPTTAAPGPAAAVSPGGQVAPDFIKSVGEFVAQPYKGPDMPKESIDQPNTVNIEGKDIKPLDLMAQAQRDLVAETNKLADAYKVERDGLKQRELFEGIVNAIGHLAAGWYGTHHGVDMSGTKFDVTDWVAQQEALRRHYDALTGLAKDRYGAAEKTGQAAERELQARRTDEEQRWLRNAKIYDAARQAYNQEQDNRFRSWQGRVKNAEIQNQQLHWQQELQQQYSALDVRLQNAQTAAAAKVAAAQRKDLADGERLGSQAVQALMRAANPRLDADAGTVLLQQAAQKNEEAKAKTGKYPIPPNVFVDPRANNSVFSLGLTADAPGPATPAKAMKSFAEGIKAPAQVPPPPATSVRMKAPNGQVGVIPADQVAKAKAAGFVEAP